MKNSILVLNGPGLADLGDYDGKACRGSTLTGIRDACEGLCESLALKLDFRQTEDPDEMFRWIAKDSEDFDGVIINPVGCSRDSTVGHPVYRSAIHMIASLKMPVIEIHVNNIFSQGGEITRPVHEPAGDRGFVCGLGLHGYLLAIRALAHRLGAGEGT